MDLFLYGTLRHPDLLRLVAGPGAPLETRPATLPGFRVEGQGPGPLPLLRQADGANAEGLLLVAPDDGQRARIDLYEVPFGYDPRPVDVTLPDGSRRPALAYFPPDGTGGSGRDWSLDDWTASEAEVSLLAAEEIAATDPPLTAEEIARNWPMIRHRAEARQRAATSTAPATLRRASTPGDVTVRHAAPLTGRFFRLDRTEIGHRRFDGGWQDGLLREVLVGADAALVLPWDPATGRILLVEQFRAGPARRGDPNPWTLEPVAGIVDAGETPSESALRETEEEAGLTLRGLRPMFDLYPSPGNATDRFHCFLGFADLPEDGGWHGGLAEEHEDLRLHVVTLDAALGLISTGEIDVGPLVAMLYWLDRERAAGRASA